MSIASEISRISQNVSDSLDAVAAKGVTVPLGSNSDDLPELIAAIPTGSGSAITIVDTTDANGGTIRTITGVSLAGDTVTAAHLETGYTAHDALGNAITGQLSPGGAPNLQAKTNINPTTASQTIEADNGYDGLSSVQINAMPTMTLPTSAASSATSGYTSKATISRSASDQYINIPTGYNSAGAYYKVSAVANGSATGPTSLSGSSATVSTGTNTITLTKTGVTTTPTVSAGYVSSATASTATVALTASVTTKAATTYHPSTSDQTIASGTYTTGAQTVKAVTVSGLEAGSIKSGVTVKIGDSTDDDCVTSVTGTYTGGGGSVSVDTKTVTASNYPVSISFTSMKGEPKYFFLRSTSQISSSGSTTYYYVIDMRYNGTDTTGNCFRIGSTRRVDNITSGYSWTYSGTTLTITSSAASRSASPGAFNNTYELVYIY